MDDPITDAADIAGAGAEPPEPEAATPAPDPHDAPTADHPFTVPPGPGVPPQGWRAHQGPWHAGPPTGHWQAPPGTGQWQVPPPPGAWQPAPGPYHYGHPGGPAVYPPYADPGAAGGSGRRLGKGMLAGLIAAIVLFMAGTAAMVLAIAGADGDAAPRPVRAAAPAPSAAAVTPAITEKPAQNRSRRRRASRERRRATRPPAAAPAPSSPATSDAVEATRVEQAVRRHWQARESGDPAAAFAIFAPSLQGQVGGLATFSSDLDEDGLHSVTIAVDATVTGATSATANLQQLHTEARLTGCKDWSGSYGMTKIDGDWRISSSSLSENKVAC